MEENAGHYSKVKFIEEDGYEDVYCLSVPETGNFIANGIVVKNCDALRYIMNTHRVVSYDPYKEKHNQQNWIQTRYNTQRTF